MRILAAIPEDSLDAVEDACRLGLVRRPVQPRCGAQHPFMGSRTARRPAPFERGGFRCCASSQRPIAPVTTGLRVLLTPRRSIVERHDLLALMTKLELAGMRAPLRQRGARRPKRQRSVQQQILGDLLSAEVAEKQARSISYEIDGTKLPLAKELSRVRVHRGAR